MKQLWLLSLAVTLSHCSAVVKGSALSSIPQNERFFLSTGPAPLPHRTLGFLQIRGYGVQVAGFVEGGDHQIDGAIRGSLMQEAAAMGGTGVVNIEFLDENPSTDSERVSKAMDAASRLINGKSPDIESRYITVTGEVIAF